MTDTGVSGHLCTVIATLVTAIAWTSLAVSRTTGVAYAFAVAAILAPLVAVVGVVTERPRWPAAVACAVSLSPATAVYIVLESLPPDFDP